MKPRVYDNEIDLRKALRGRTPTRARFTEVKCLFRGNAVTLRQFTITLAIRNRDTVLGSRWRKIFGVAQRTAAGKRTQWCDRRDRVDCRRVAHGSSNDAIAECQWRGASLDRGPPCR